MSELNINGRYEDIYVFYSRKIVKSGDRYILYVPNDLAEVLIKKYGGYVDFEIKAPSVYPKKKKKE